VDRSRLRSGAGAAARDGGTYVRAGDVHHLLLNSETVQDIVAGIGALCVYMLAEAKADASRADAAADTTDEKTE
jgi:hypothetical protein